MDNMKPLNPIQKTVVGVQFLFVAFVATFLVPLLVGLDPSTALFTAGIGTLIFHLVTKGKVPIFLGSSFAFVAPIIKATELYGLPGTMSGLVAVGTVYGLMSLLVRWRGIGFIKRLFPPVVIGPVIVGYLTASLFGLIDFKPVIEAPWFAFPQFVKPSLSWEAVIFMIPVTIAPVIEHIGDVYAINEVTGKDFVKDPGLHRTMLGDGLACIVAGLIGGPPVTTYSEVTGAISLTKITDPAVIRIAAVSGIIFSVFGKVSALLKSIPAAVLGGIMLLLFGTIAAVGINSLIQNRTNLGDTRNLIIVSLILTFGIGGAAIEFGGFTMAGIGLSALLGVFLNLVLPKSKTLP